jgi:hypothetical protein
VTYVPYGTALNRGEQLITSFSDPAVLPTGFGLSGTATFQTGSSGVWAAPAFGASTFDTGQYLNVGKGQYEILSTPALHELSMYVGSLDAYNKLTFFFQTGGSISFTGGDLAALANAVDNGDRVSGQSNGRFTFTFSSPVTSVGFYSSGYSFEVANVAATWQGPAFSGAIPEPSVWAMMLAGIGAAGATLRRRRRLAGSIAR